MRYLDLARFLFLLEHSAVYCPAAPFLEDPFEGSLSAADIIEGRNPVNAVVRERVLRKSTYISCWCLSDYESVAMWKLYGSAVAIHTSFNKLRSLFDSQGFQVGLVGYYDFDADRINTGIHSLQYFFKRKEFSFEHEVRAVGMPEVEEIDFEQDCQPTPGISVPVDFGQFIDRITVAPGSSAWFVELIKRLCERYKLTAPVLSSRLDVEPRF